jgi:cation diffusion facilitator CzcD-associated flavoprotein CzcO
MVSSAQSISSPVDDDARAKVHVLVIGAGFGGLGTAMKLKQAGIDDFVVLERASEIGGT